MSIIDFPKKSTMASPDTEANFHAAIRVQVAGLDTETVLYAAAMAEALSEVILELPKVLQENPDDVAFTLGELFCEYLAGQLAVMRMPGFSFDDTAS